MKKHLLVCILLLISLTAFSQKGQKTIGVISSLNGNLGVESYYRSKPGNASGIFYDHLFSRRFGLNTGVQVAFERFTHPGWDNCRDCDGAILQKGITRNTYLEVPVNLTFLFNPDSRSGWRTYLFSGMLLNQQIASKSKLYYADSIRVLREKGEWRDLWSYGHMLVGFEVRKNVGNHYNVAIGTSAKFNPAYSLDFGSDVREPITVNINLKFGRNL